MRYGRKLAVLLGATALGFAAVWGRAFQLQVVERSAWAAQAERTRRPVQRIEAPRGRILDARGEVLAEDRPVVRLAFVGGEWETRTRWRCRDCGHPQFRRDPDAPRRPGMRASEAAPPTRCSCGARGAGSFERLPEDDLAPLEEELGLPAGALKALASQRTAELERAVEARVTRLAGGDEAGAQGRDLRFLVRQDHFARPVALPVLEFPGRAPIPIRDLPEGAIRRLELDVEGRYRGFRAVAGVERRYPKGALLAQAIGFTTGVQREDLEGNGGRLGRDVTWATRVGRAGLERFYDAALRGTPGRLRWTRDEDGDLVPRVEVPARPGLDVHLGLTVAACAEAQRVLESVATPEGYGAHGPASGGFVAIDADTGEVLAWAEAPVFDLDGDLSEVVRFTDGEDARGVSPDSDGPVPTDEVTPNAAYSRVAQIAVEPGSAMKVPTALALLHLGAPLPQNFACAGPARTPTDKPGCHDHPGFGYLTLEDALCVSCNRWFAYAVTKADAQALCRDGFPGLMDRLGFARAPGLDLPLCAKGWYRTNLERTLRNMAMGQGGVAVTPIQMARLMALLADGRRLPVARLAVGVGDVARPASFEEPGVAPEAIARVRTGLRAAVSQRGGTAARAFAEAGLPAGTEVAGKTGTAQVANGGDFDPDRMKAGPWHHWFVGYARGPGSRRTVAFAIVLYSRTEPAAGETASRAAGRWLRWWFDAEGGR